MKADREAKIEIEYKLCWRLPQYALPPASSPLTLWS